MKIELKIKKTKKNNTKTWQFIKAPHLSHISGFEVDVFIPNIYIYITNCRQYCFGLLGLISAVLMLGWR